MRYTNISSLRNNLAAALESVNDDHVPLLVTRRGGRPGAVLTSFEDFTTMEAACFPTRTANEAILKPQAAAPVPPPQGRAR